MPHLLLRKDGKMAKMGMKRKKYAKAGKKERIECDILMKKKE